MKESCKIYQKYPGARPLGLKPVYGSVRGGSASYKAFPSSLYDERDSMLYPPYDQTIIYSSVLEENQIKAVAGTIFLEKLNFCKHSIIIPHRIMCTIKCA